jgi:integrase
VRLHRSRSRHPVRGEPTRLLEDEEEPISERLTPHGLRHTYASLLAALGENPVHIADQLGHGDPAFSLRVYAKTISRRDGELDRLRALVNGAESPEESRAGTGAKVVAR